MQSAHHRSQTERSSKPELLLRRLAAGDEVLLRSLRGRSCGGSVAPPVSGSSLPPSTTALVHLAALLAVGASTTSLRWAVELALRSGAEDEEIVEVLAIVARIAGSAQVVAAAPRLALAIGYDIEVEGWDGY